MSQNQLWSKTGNADGTLWQKPGAPAPDHTPDAKTLSAAEARVKNPGKRYAQIVKLKPEHYAEYKRVHATVWPEVAAQIKSCSIVDCTYGCLLIMLGAGAGSQLPEERVPGGEGVS